MSAALINIDSYSVFFDNGHQKGTGLGEYLLERNLRAVYIAGLATNYCVKFSVLEANFSGHSAVWLARFVRDEEVVGSNPTAPSFF